MRRLCRKAGGDLEQIQFLLGNASVQITERYLGTEQILMSAVNDGLGLAWSDAYQLKTMRLPESNPDLGNESLSISHHRNSVFIDCVFPLRTLKGEPQ